MTEATRTITSTLTPEQRELRKQGLGASEVAAVLGLDPHRTPLDVFLEKTGQIAAFPGNQYTRWGNRLEDDIIEEYQERHPGWTVLPSPTVIGPESWMLATPDRRVVMAGAPTPAPIMDRGLECKCRGQYDRDAWGEEGTDEVPHAVAIQCHWGMIVTGLKVWDVAVLLGGNDYREYTIRYDEAVAASLVEKARHFWFEHVLKDVHPKFTGARSDHAFLLRNYPTHSGEIVVAPPDISLPVERLRHLREQRAQLEKEIDEIEANLKEFIGDRRGLQGPGFKITWTHLDAVEVKAFTRPATRRFVCQFNK